MNLQINHIKIVYYDCNPISTLYQISIRIIIHTNIPLSVSNYQENKSEIAVISNCIFFVLQGKP